MDRYTEIKNDINKLSEGLNKAGKVAIASKYSISSCKTEEIKKELYLILRDIRSTKVEFTTDDLNDYSRLNVPEKTKLQSESPNFIKFYKEHLEKLIKSKKLDGKIYAAHTIDWNYYMTPNDKYIIEMYEKAVKVFDSINPSNVVDNIAEKLMKETQEFFNSYISSVKSQAERFYREIPTTISKLENKLTSAKSDRAIEKIKSTIKRLSIIYNDGCQKYIDDEIDRATKSYKSEIADLANRFAKHGIDESLKVSDIYNDIKLFTMTVECHDEIFYCRAIIAAEYSEKVATHVRFIITK